MCEPRPGLTEGRAGSGPGKKEEEDMKKIEAIVEPAEVEGIKEELSTIGIRSVTVTEVRGFGASGGRTLVYRGVRFDAPYVVEAKLETVVADEVAERAVAILRKEAKTDEERQPRVFVLSLDDASRLRSVAAL
jgi:nitrogen regulatory protein P-II 1